MARGSVSKRCTCKLPDGQPCRKPHGTWTVRVDVGIDSTGRRRQIRRSGFTTRAEAQTELTAILAGLDSGTWTNDQGVTTGEWLTRWLAGLRDVKPTTVAGYRRHIEDVWVPELGRVMLRDLRRRHVEDVLAALGDGRSPRTVDSYRRTLRAALSEAQIHGLIAANPAQGRMRSIGRLADAEERRVWEPDEVGRFLAGVERSADASLRRLANAYDLLVHTGMRRADLCGLRWTDVEPDGAGLTISQTIVQLARSDIPEDRRACPVCGREHVGLLFDSPKSARGRRFVPLVEAAQLALGLQREAQRAEREAAGDDWDEHGLVFTHALHGGWPLPPDDLSRGIQALADELGLPRIRLHDLRHVAASVLISGGVPIEVVAKILGHDPQVTRSTYGHLMRGEAARQMGEAMQVVSLHRRAHSVPTRPVSGDERPADIGRDLQ